MYTCACCKIKRRMQYRMIIVCNFFQGAFLSKQKFRFKICTYFLRYMHFISKKWSKSRFKICTCFFKVRTCHEKKMSRKAGSKFAHNFYYPSQISYKFALIKSKYAEISVYTPGKKGFPQPTQKYF